MSKRLTNVIEQMKLREMDYLVVCDPYSIYYLTGCLNMPGERFYALLLKQDASQVLFANRLFNIPELDINVIYYSDGDDPIGKLASFLNKGVVGIDRKLTANFLLPLMEKCAECRFVIGSGCVDYCRGSKDEEEIKLMKEASRINDIVITKAADYVKEGMSEREVARFIEQQYLKEGAQGVSFDSIVSFGANAADPHHMPDDTVLKKGDVVLFDIGCIKDRYCSDMTRTFFYGEVNDKQKEVYQLVLKANTEAEKALKPGFKLADIDGIARGIITDGGYGEFFTHRLGHFIGMEVHEAGDVAAYNQDVARAGMIFSIEPGIYLKDDFGVRIEDLVLVTEDGCEVLNRVDKSLKLL